MHRKYKSSFRILQTSESNITLPPDFVVINSLFTLYYQFDVNSSSVNSTANTTTANVTNATNSSTNTSEPLNNETISNQTNTATIDLYMVFQGHNWFALGFGNVANGTEMIVCEIVNDTIVVSDQYSSNNSLPTPDTDQNGTSDVTLVDRFMNSTTMIVHVTRLQNTNDPLDFVFTGPGNYNITWAYSPSLTLQDYQGDGARGITTVTLENTNGTLNNDTQQLKGSAGGGGKGGSGGHGLGVHGGGGSGGSGNSVRLSSSMLIVFILGLCFIL
jgi:uncharacterized membrane protein YgcG